jgi:hypothetical protein
VFRWHAGQDDLTAAGARTGPDAKRAAPCGRTVTRVLALVSGRALSRAVSAWLTAGERRGPVTFPLAGPVLLPRAACDGKAGDGAGEREHPAKAGEPA